MKIITKRQATRRLMATLKDAYRERMTTWPNGGDWNNVSQAIGQYNGLKQAYIILTGRSSFDVGNEVVTWYITTPEYQASKENHER